MSQHFNSMLEHLKMASRKESASLNGGGAVNASPKMSPLNCTNEKSGGGNEKGGGGGSISALIQKFSSPLPINKNSERQCNKIVNNVTNNNNGNDPKAKDVVDCALDELSSAKGSTFLCNLSPITTKKVIPNSAVRKNSNQSVDINLSEAPPVLVSNGAIVSVKRQSISSQHESRARDLSPANDKLLPGSNTGLYTGQRKLSADFRNCNNEDGVKPAIFKPIRVKNVTTKAESYDTLHCKAIDKVGCTREICQGSIMFPTVATTASRKPEVVLEHAKDFLEQYFTSIKRLKTPAYENRWQQVQRDIESTGTYQLTETELVYGAKLAWRNAYRCIGRIQWSKLQLFDCRYVTTTSGMFEAICNHIKYATNKGNLRSAITIFPQRTPHANRDYRIWNPQLISYAGYRQMDGTVIGDPMNVEFTELCTRLGWKGKGTPWDILPMVLSANGHDPEYFEYPDDLILEVPLVHPTFEWFGEMGLRWYAVPAVSSMLFDCGGIQFTATSFSGWYMSTEIGCRNLCDTNRRNLLEPIAIKMGLDTRNPTSLWKDKALVEINIAVLYSYQIKNVTIVDHHTASESFMKHLENESKLRSGCPADWVWIVPPMSSSITPVYHQEMVSYYLRPSFEYQEPAHKTHEWKKGRDSSKNKKPKRKFHFKQIARAVKFTSKLFGRALSRRIKATIIYATETGKSENYARQLCELLGHAFNAQVYSMADYDISSIEHEALLLVVVSTFGNGDPPENGETFAHDLYAMKLQESEEDPSTITENGLRVMPVSSKSFIKQNSRIDGRSSDQQTKKIDRLDSLRGSLTEHMPEESFGPLSNVRFAVFGLGSSAYPNFCAFGKYVDNLLGELGGERLLKLATGDEMCGQEQTFRQWAPEVFKIACDTFCLDTDEKLYDAAKVLQGDLLTVNTLRFATQNLKTHPLDTLFEKYHNKKTFVGTLKREPTGLQNCEFQRNKFTILVEIQAEGITYEPGDHVGIFPANRKEIVDGVLEKLVGVDDVDRLLQLEVLKENHTQNGIVKNWEPHEKLPVCSLRNLLTRFLDITTPPSRQLLTLLASFCDNAEEASRLQLLADDPSAYEDWRYWRMPHLLEVLEEFPSCNLPASVLIVNLMPLQPRFYSISSSLKKHNNEIHLTVAIVKYRSEDGQGAQHFGVCSNYLSELQKDDKLYYFIRSAVNFRVPNDSKRPVLLIGPGTGIAPFRSFWQHFDVLKTEVGVEIPKIWLFFGCRDKTMDLYAAEKKDLLDRGILHRVFLALSREPDVPKTYVQDVALAEAESIYKLIVLEKGHVYVCGDVTMAEHVYQTLRRIIASHGHSTENEAEKLMLSLRDENRYHEDIFGITLRTAEVQNKSRASARIRMASNP